MQPAGLIESLRVEAGLTCPLLSQLKCFGTCKLDLKKRLKAMRIQFDKIQHNRVKTMQPVEVFEDQIKPDLGTPQNARWVEFGHVDTPDESCEALISISLVPQDYALKWPQGECRAIPNDSPYLAPPKRVQSKKKRRRRWMVFHHCLLHQVWTRRKRSCRRRCRVVFVLLFYADVFVVFVVL